MPKMSIDFEWEVNKQGYEFVERPVGAPPKIQTVMSGNYDSDPANRMFLKPRGAATRNGKPLEAEPQLFLKFSQLDGSAEDCIGFASRYGKLYEETTNESHGLWQDRIKSMSSWIHSMSDDPVALRGRLAANDLMIGRLDVKLRAREGKVSTVYVPTNLITAMYLQLSQWISGDRRVKACENCGVWFEQKRSDKRFCSSNCRVASHNLRNA